MLYRFLQSSCRPVNNSRETIIPSIPETAAEQLPDDRNMSRIDKYAGECVGRDRNEQQEYNYNSRVTRNDDYITSNKDYVVNKRDYLQPPLCNRNRNKNFHSREGSSSIPSVYNGTQNDTNKRSNDHINSLPLQYTHNDFRAYDTPSETLEENISPNSDYGSEVWGSSYIDEDDTTTEGSYTIEQFDSPTHKHSRSYVLAPNEAYC